jgi:predicted PurR-regulated permease PerM
MKNSFWWIVFIFIILGLFIGYLSSFGLDDSQRTMINYISIYGTYASLFALAITLVQVISIKSISEETQRQVQKYENKSEQIYLVSNLPKHIRFIREAKQYINTDEYKLALLRLTDVKDFLNTLNHSSLDIVKDDTEILSTLGIDMVNIEDAAYREKVIINKDITNNLEVLISALSKLENNSKQIRL